MNIKIDVREPIEWATNSKGYHNRKMIEACNKTLSDKPLFFLINSYTTGVSSTVLANILKTTIKLDGKISCGEVGIPITKRDLILPCGIYGRWEEND